MKTNYLYFLISVLAVLSFSIVCPAQQVPQLEKIISIEIRGLSQKESLDKISSLGNFTFSYNSSLVDENKRIHLVVENKSIRQVLDMIFEGSVSYKHKGNYVILTKAPPPAKKNSPTPLTITGYVTDSYSGERIAAASVFDQTTLSAANTDAFGFFNLKIDKPGTDVRLSVYKNDYSDTLITIQPFDKPIIPVEVALNPSIKQEAIIPTPKVPEEDSVFIPTPLPIPAGTTQELMMQNITDTIYRKFQVSFLPFMGTNDKLSGNVVNEVSFNIFGGYSMGTSKFELGGLFNTNRDYSEKVQIAGLFNQVGGNVDGVQVGGIFNCVGGKVDGVQVGGIFNISQRSVKGVQIAGIFNLSGDSLNGVAVAGIFNHYRQNTDGVMVAGILNHQNGFCDGVQVSGLINSAPKGIKGAQIAGLINYSGTYLKGSQISGLVNFNRDSVSGTQIAGLVNYSNQVKGSQIGFLNIADSVSGVPIGFLSYINNGHHSIEVSTNESFTYNVSFHTGVRSLYNIFSSGITPRENGETSWYYGYGLGSSPRLGKKLDLNIQLTSSWINTQNAPEFNLLNRFFLGIDYHITKTISIFGGGSLTGLLTKKDNLHPLYLPLSEEDIFYERDFRNEVQLDVFPGFSGGLRFWW